MATPEFPTFGSNPAITPAPGTVQFQASEQLAAVFTPPPPDPEVSWLSYNCFVHLVEDDHVVRHKPLAGSVGVNTPSTLDPFAAIQLLAANQTSQTQLPISSTVDDVFQRICSPSVSVWLIGSARRLGYTINPPRLLTYAGFAVVQRSQRLASGQVGGVNGVPIYGMSWQIEYGIVRPPQTMPVPGNPAMGLDGSLVAPPFAQPSNDVTLGQIISG